MAVTGVGIVLLLGACGAGSNKAITTTTAPTGGSGSSTTSTSRPASENPAAVPVKVWFLDGTNAATGKEPLFRPVERMVHPPGLATAALHALFAGPTPEERAQGLRLITSEATGFRGLRIADGVAHVTLVGGCASRGSTMTIAGELVPTLEQFASVTHVKIYAPDGSTEEPSGTGDSIPFCLEP